MTTKPNLGEPQDQRDSEALKPCPFCGSDAEYIHVYAGEEIVRCVTIDNCGVFLNGDDEYELRLKWNHRPAPEAFGAAKGELSDAENYLQDIESLMRACVKNINVWSFPEYDMSHRAVEKIRAILAAAKDQS